MGLQIEARQGVQSNSPQQRFIHNTEYGDQVSIFGLGDEFGEDTDVIEGALGVCYSHVASEEVWAC